jgi:outer membrane protein assembly factor BamB
MSARPIFGLDAETGRVVWQGKGSGPQGYAAIATDGEKIYAGVGGSTYGAFDIKTKRLTGNFSGGHQARQFMSMTFANGKVYIPVTMRGAVMCVDKDAKNHVQGRKWYTAALDGQLNIELNQGGKFGCEMFTDLAVTATKVYAGCNDGALYTFDAETGAKGWSFDTGDKVQSSPSVANGMVYFGSWDGNLYALDALSGKLLWKQPLGDRIISSPWPADGAVYVGCDNGSVYALK